jgi:seryl-tRNA synthetase
MQSLLKSAASPLKWKAALDRCDEMRRSACHQGPGLAGAPQRRLQGDRQAAMAAKDTEKAEALKAEVAEIKSFIQSGEDTERELTAKLNDALSRAAERAARRRAGGCRRE